MKTLLALATVVSLSLGCGGPAKKAPDGPRPDDVPREITCCVAVGDDGTPTHTVTPVEQCAEDNRNPVDACDIGPGDAEPTE